MIYICECVCAHMFIDVWTCEEEFVCGLRIVALCFLFAHNGHARMANTPTNPRKNLHVSQKRRVWIDNELRRWSFVGEIILYCCCNLDELDHQHFGSITFFAFCCAVITIVIICSVSRMANSILDSIYFSMFHGQPFNAFVIVNSLFLNLFFWSMYKTYHLLCCQ